jgi:hypothetical protein
VQVSIAALRERLESLESHTFGSTSSLPGTLAGRRPGVDASKTGGLSGSNPGAGGSNGPANGGCGPELVWDPARMGLWSVVLVPATHLVNQIRYILILLLSPPSSEPLASGQRARRRGGAFDARTIVRRLILDASFVFALSALLRSAWSASGIRRREVIRALRLLWVAILGRAGARPGRVLVDRGVGN